MILPAETSPRAGKKTDNVLSKITDILPDIFVFFLNTVKLHR